MSIDLTEQTTPPSSRLGKRKSLRSDLFTKKLFVQIDFPSEHKDVASVPVESVFLSELI
jgi:hypothetical protein